MQLWFSAKSAPAPALASQLGAQGGNRRGRVGMGLRFRGAEVVVTTIIDGSPAALGGVRIGDVVLSVANEIQLNDAPENVWVDVTRFSEEQLPSLIAGNGPEFSLRMHVHTSARKCALRCSSLPIVRVWTIFSLWSSCPANCSSSCFDIARQPETRRMIVPKCMRRPGCCSSARR